jgi:hypothetical protein
MLIRILTSKAELNSAEWANFKKIHYLTQNKDLSLLKFGILNNGFEWIIRDFNIPRIGILTNGYQWIIRDFEKKKWLENIPTRKKLKGYVNIKKYIFLKLLYIIRICYNPPKITLIIPASVKENFVKNFSKLTNLIIRKLKIFM